MGNRKARWAAEGDAQENEDVDIPLSQPDRSGPKAKTLYEIAAERQAELSKGQPFEKQDGSDASKPELVNMMLRPDGTVAQLKDGLSDDELLGPFGQALFNAITLTMLHFTLEVLVHHQYRTEVSWDQIFWKTLMAFPFLLLLVYIVHQRASTMWAQGLLLVSSIIAGCYLIQTSNRAAYYAVMKSAPPLGTLWVWTVMEMRLKVAVVSLAAVGFYFWWGDYTIFN